MYALVPFRAIKHCSVIRVVEFASASAEILHSNEYPQGLIACKTTLLRAVINWPFSGFNAIYEDKN